MILLLFVLFVVQSAFAQRALGSVTGRITLNDQRPGQLASSILVELVGEQSQGDVVRSSVNSEGDYQFLNVAPGRYIVKASAPGFKPAKSHLELLPTNQQRGDTRLVLLQEQETSGSSPQIGTVTQNELRAPKSALRQLELAEASLNRNDFENAAAAADKALNLYPHFARAYYVRGRILQKQQKVAQALANFEKSIEEDANLYPAYAAIAEIYRVGEEAISLEKISSQWKKVQPLEAAPYYYSALAAFQKGEHQTALDEALLATRFPTANVPHLNLLLANCYLKLRNAGAAAARLREFLSAFPQDPMAPQVRSTLASLEKISRQ